MGMRPAVISHLVWGALRSWTLHAWRAGDRYEEFVETFRPEGLLPLDDDSREAAPLAGRCIACGACEYSGCSPRSILEASRGLQDLSRAAGQIRVLAGLDTPVVSAMEDSCPAGIPFGRIAVQLGRLLDTGPELG